MDHRLRQNTNYILTFGGAGTGKSTLLAVLAKFVAISDATQLIPNGRDNNLEGFKVYIGWLEKLAKGQFPPKTVVTAFNQVEAAIEVKKKALYPMTFLEMSGEDLEKIINLNNADMDVEELRNDFNDFLGVTKATFVVIPAKSAELWDLIAYQFVVELEKKAVTTPLAVIFTKWDELENNAGVNFESFVRGKIPLTYSYIRGGNFVRLKFFKFSVGTVKVGNGTNPFVIDKIDYSYCRPILNWLMNSLQSY